MEAVPYPLDFLAGGGEMGARVRALDWSATPLGEPRGWPQSLRSAISILLPSKAQIVLFWGPEFVTLYNDAYRPVFGAKHPWALGRPARECWREVWDVLEPLFEGVVRTGEAFWARDHPFHIKRNGYAEETYFDVSYDPVRDETGTVGGVFCIVSETTGRVVGERRLRALHELAARPADARNVADACRLFTQTLESYPFDVPFALLYLLEKGEAELAAAAGVPAGHALRAVSRDSHAGWPILDVARDRQVLRLDDLPERFPTLAPGPWPDAPTSALLFPEQEPGQARPVGVLVLGVSARRPLDEDYRAWLEMLGHQVAFSMANAQASEGDRRRAEALAELDRAKTAFFSNVSHEFRTPLTLMLGPVEDALADAAKPLDPENRRRLETAHRNSMRLLKLVNTLLDFSRIEAGRALAVYEPTDLGALTEDLASSFRSACEGAGLRLLVECAPLPESIYVDRDMWEKIVLNLLSNAFKFTFDGEIVVALRPAGDRVELVVRDTGTGIPAEELPHLFERFRTVRGARSRSHEGTGIGLALVSELVALQGGTVAVESAPDRGSAFTVSVPRGHAHLPADRVRASSALAPARAAAPYVQEALRWIPDEGEERRPAAGPARATGGHVLLADDNADMREYVARLLAPHWTVTAVADGEAALDAVDARRPDLVLADVMMPRLDGLGLLRALRSRPDTETLPVILLSARAGEESRVDGLSAGADDYLVKPFAARELVARVRAHLDQGRARQQVVGRERTARAQAERASRAKDEFLATLSHELRTPLNAILGWSVMLRETPRDPVLLGKGLEIIERNTRAQSALIEDLLDLSRIISGQMRLEVRTVDLLGVVGAALDSVRLGAEAKGIQIQTALDAGAGPVAGDPDRLQQVLWNLLSNAVKFTPPRGRIQVRLERVNSHVTVVVSDTGCGIPADVLPFVFDRFWQGDGSSSRRHGGLGLGLALVKHLVELHGGTVRAESPGTGEGTTFVLELPRVAAVTSDPDD